MAKFSKALTRELQSLSLEGLVDLLGEILEPTFKGPFDNGAALTDERYDDLYDEMDSIVVAYRGALHAITKIVADDCDDSPYGWDDL